MVNQIPNALKGEYKFSLCGRQRRSPRLVTRGSDRVLWSCAQVAVDRVSPVQRFGQGCIPERFRLELPLEHA